MRNWVTAFLRKNIFNLKDERVSQMKSEDKSTPRMKGQCKSPETRKNLSHLKTHEAGGDRWAVNNEKTVTE